jgi:hypothetical protein
MLVVRKASVSVRVCFQAEDGLVLERLSREEGWDNLLDLQERGLSYAGFRSFNF